MLLLRDALPCGIGQIDQGGGGKAGKLIVKEAVGRGMGVTAIVRGENKTEAEKVLVKDAMELTSENLAGFDAVVDAVGTWTPDTVSTPLPTPPCTWQT